MGVIRKTFPSPEYHRLPLEIALGASSQHIVEDEGAANTGNRTSEECSGRATFLPLTTIKPRYLAGKNQELIEARPVPRMASSLVGLSPSLESIFQSLGVTAIFDMIEHAKAAARKGLPSSYRDTGWN